MTRTPLGLLLAVTLASTLAATLASNGARAADPVRIGVDTPLSGTYADRGQSVQYGVELALARINQSGGVLGRPVEAFYADNAGDEAKGVAGARRLVEQEHVSAVIGALVTAVTHAVMPVMQSMQVPLVVEVSAGQDFVDASGVGGNAWVFKTIPSDKDIAEDLVAWLKQQGVKSVATVTDDAPFNAVNGGSFARVAAAGGLNIALAETVPKGADLAAVVARVRAAGPDSVVLNLGASTAPFFKAYEQAGGGMAVSGRVDLAAAIGAVSPAFTAAGGLGKVTGITVFSPAIAGPGIQGFVAAYRAKYGLMPTQRSFFAYEAANLVVAAIAQAGSDKPADVQRALKASTMVSLLGGTYAMDDHNHPHMPMQMLGVRDGRVAVIDKAKPVL